MFTWKPSISGKTRCLGKPCFWLNLLATLVSQTFFNESEELVQGYSNLFAVFFFLLSCVRPRVAALFGATVGHGHL